MSHDYGLDTDRVGRAEPLPAALRRRFDGRYTFDGFGLDPHLADLVRPIVSTLVRVEASGEENVPAEGAAALVANRGFGIFEPAALGVAVQRAVGRRLRVVGSPNLPFVGSFVRRVGAISDSPRDLAAALRAGHLVAVPLAPTWLRTGAGMPPLPLMVAMTHTRIIPVGVTPGGPLGTMLRPWRVRFGSLVTLTDPYEAGDPLTAARFAEALRDSVSSLLKEP
jgi:hypothetical protein